MDNPYATPQTTELNTPSGNEIMALPRFSAWGVFGLSAITMGLYQIYWLFHRTGIVNQHINKKISPVVKNGFPLSALLFFPVSIMAAFQPENATLSTANSVLYVTYLVLFYTNIFQLRNRICDEMLQQPRFSGLLTFFFSTIYLQYKINEAIDLQQA